MTGLRHEWKAKGTEWGKKKSVGLEFFTHYIKLLITALEHQHGESAPVHCDLGRTHV